MKRSIIPLIQAKAIILFCLCLIGQNTNSQGVKNAFPRINDFKNIKFEFLSPSNEYAPHGFWFWNDSLDTEKSSYMAREMAAKGMNPGYIHPRHYAKTVGLPIDQWLSEEYFQCVEDVLRVCDSTNTYLGFCDDYWWPSGRVGGKMVAKHPDMQAHELSWEQWKIPGPWKVILPTNEFIVACQESEPGIIDTKTLQVISNGERKEWKVPEGSWVMYIFNVIASPSRGRGPDRILVNYMEPDLAGHFIDMGFKPYEAHLKKYMGKSLKYCFSDNEGEYGNRLPWSKYLVKFYEELYDDDIRKWMPLLLANDSDGKYVTARYRWFNMVSEMYAHKFWKPINDWLAERGLYYISNFWEANLMMQAATVGDYFRVNRAFSFPGNDCLMMDARDLRHFKEIQSVCEFEHRPFMSEIMGVQGWQQTPAEMKEVANLATSWGVTQVVPHGVNLNRDIKNCIHPTDWFEENPYWQTFDEWTNFCKRASMINKQGVLATDVLIYNPMVSIWSLSDNFLSGRASARNNWDTKMASEINTSYYDIQKALSNKNIEYLIADDVLMLQSELDKENNKLHIKEHSFNTIYLPPLFTLKIDVYKKILDFASSGGRIVVLGNLPVSSAEKGMDDPVILQMNKELLSCKNVIDFLKKEGDVCQEASLESNGAIKMETNDFKLYSTHRIIDGMHFYWLANNSGKRQYSRLTFTEGSGRAEKWNCETGAIEYLNYSASVKGNTINLDFGPFEGFWLVFNSRENNDERAIVKEQIINLINRKWKIRVVDTVVNVSTAGIFTESSFIKNPGEIAPKEWSRQKVTWPIAFIGKWNTDWIKAKITKKHGYFINQFELNENPQKAYLSLSLPKGSELYVNANKIELTQSNYWKEPANVNILQYLKKGKNRIGICTKRFVKTGDYWMLVQGEIVDSVNQTVLIESGKDWKMAELVPNNWKNPTCKINNLEPAPVVPWKNLTWTNKHEIHPPAVQEINNEDNVWLRFEVPPGAVRLETGNNTERVEIWIDERKYSNVKDGRIPLSKKSKLVFLKAKKEYLKFTKPLTFICQNKETCHLRSWSDWGLDRYTGFLEYEQEFKFGQSLNEKKVILELGKLKYVAEVYVNGEKAGARMWPPFDYDITDCIVNGKNTIRVRVGNLISNQMALYDDFNELYRWGNYGTPKPHYFNAGLEGDVRLKIIEIKHSIGKNPACTSGEQSGKER